MTTFQQLQYSLAALWTSAEPVTERADAHRLAALELRPTAELSSIERLEIYQEQYWLRHSGCLVDDYPGVAGVVGHEHWERFVEEYLGWARTDGWSLKDLGEQLERFVTERGNWLPRRQLCLDMVRLESAYMQIFDAPDTSELDQAALGRMEPEQWATARLVLSPALRLLRFEHPVDDLRRRLRAAGPGQTVATPAPREVHAVVYRGRDRILYHRGVDAEQWQVLHALQRGAALVTAFERVAGDDSVLAAALVARAETWFGDWPRLGWIADVRVG